MKRPAPTPYPQAGPASDRPRPSLSDMVSPWIFWTVVALAVVLAVAVLVLAALLAQTAVALGAIVDRVRTGGVLELPASDPPERYFVVPLSDPAVHPAAADQARRPHVSSGGGLLHFVNPRTGPGGLALKPGQRPADTRAEYLGRHPAAPPPGDFPESRP